MKLEETISILMTQQYLKRDIIVNSKGVVMDENNLLQIEDSESILRYTLKSGAKRQLCEVTDIPFRFYELLEKKSKETLQTCVNNLLHFENKNYLIRTILDDDSRNQIRAILSDRYRIINNLDVLEAVNTVLQDVEHSADVDISEDYLYCSITFDFNKISIAGMEALPSLLVVNSEVGDGAFKIIPRVTLDKEISFSVNNVAIRKAHLGVKNKKGVQFESLDEELREQIITSIDNYINSELLFSDPENIEKMLFKTFADIYKSFDKILQDLGFTEDEKRLAVVYFLQTTKSNTLDIIRSVIKVSNKFTTKRREEVENKVLITANKYK